ncbi:hypothetical protein PENSPDRAFT_737095 [Peniophora sp. CONT]|nr:hypothetical protein PENSPDRAFT_737095 [Peniophora sp. CONT]
MCGVTRKRSTPAAQSYEQSMRRPSLNHPITSLTYSMQYFNHPTTFSHCLSRLEIMWLIADRPLWLSPRYITPRPARSFSTTTQHDSTASCAPPTIIFRLNANMSVLATELFARRLTAVAGATTRAHTRTRRYRTDFMQPNPNPPPAMELDINPDDGYTLVARGELSKDNENMLPSPPSELELERYEHSVQLPIKRPLAPRRCSVSKTKNYRLGSISPTCSGTRFPDYPKPDSPPHVKKEYDDFVKSMNEQKAELAAKQAEAALALSARSEEFRQPSALVTPARQRAPVKPRVYSNAQAAPTLAMPVPQRAVAHVISN